MEQIQAEIAQLGERRTEDLEVPGSILGLGIAPWIRQSKLRSDQKVKRVVDGTGHATSKEGKKGDCSE